MSTLRARAIVAGAAIALPALSLCADVNPNAGMLRYPDVSDTHIVFMYANDLWLVPRDGAFTGNYEGGTDLYTIPVSGGIPTRVTHHPSGEVLCGWTPDGKLLYSSSGQSGLGRAPKLFTVGATMAASSGV